MLNREDIIQLIKTHEKVDVEFKEAKKSIPSNVFETYSSFCNTNGGIIILGIKENKDKNTSYEITGVNNIQSVRNDFWNNINNKEKISANLLEDEDVYEVDIDDDKKVLVIHVPRAKYYQKPVYKGTNPYFGTYKRSYEGDYRLDKEMVNAMIRDQFTSSNDDEIIDYFDIEDLDSETVHAYRNRFSSTNKGHVYNELTDIDFLSKIGAYKKDKRRKIEGITRAGALIFGKSETFNDLFSYVTLDYRDETHLVGDMRWSDRIIENGLWEKNLYNFITKVYPKLVSDFPTPFHMKDSLQRIDESRLHIAAREALSNLVIHADFNEKPCTLLIIKKEDFLYFSNSGMLRMSLEEVLHGGTSLARNTTVQKILRFIGFGESAGSGFDKILAPSRKEGYIMPDLTEREGIRSTVLKLWTVKKSVHQTEQIKDIDLSDNQKFIYNLLKENPGLSIKQIKEKCDFNSNAVEYAIRILREKHFITYSRSENDSTKGYFII